MSSPPPLRDIRDKIQELLKGANLDEVTVKSVRHDLENSFGVDLSSRKKEISSIIAEIIRDQDSSSSSDEGVEDATPRINNKNAESVNKSSSSSEDGMDDEEVARKLQEEESRLRKTRSGGKTSKASKSKPTKKKEGKAKSTGRGGSGFTKSLPLSPELADFTGETEMARHEVVKRVWDYCKENNLMDPKNKQFAICDSQLLKVMGKKRFRLFGMMKLLSRHFEK